MSKAVFIAYGVVPLIKQVGHRAGIAVDAKHQLSKVIGTNCKAIKDRKKRFRQNHICRNFAHDIDLKSVLALYEAVFRHLGNDAMTFFYCPAEGKS